MRSLGPIAARRKKTSVYEYLHAAAQDDTRISGLTHSFYRHPAPFPPVLAETAIRTLTSPGDLVVDPFLGGGTTAVEALAAGRHVIGTDLNPLAVFVSRVKTTPISGSTHSAVHDWGDYAADMMTYRYPSHHLGDLMQDPRARNLGAPAARALKKGLAIGIATLGDLPGRRSMDFARCALLCTGQWALDGRRHPVALGEFRSRLKSNVTDMLSAIRQFGTVLSSQRKEGLARRTVALADARSLERICARAGHAERARLVLTSPPYPGVHVLYHRWQVGGRRETPAPYWIADLPDPERPSSYTLGDRRAARLTEYFSTMLQVMNAVREVIHPDGHAVQVIAFSDPDWQLQKYLDVMDAAGFREVSFGQRCTRIERQVPNRRWYASMKGQTSSSREFVLVHRPV